MAAVASEDRHVELAEDNWIAIFSYLSTPAKLRASQVCKEWHAVIMHPLFWKSVEVTFGVHKRRQSIGPQYDCVMDFITKYCPSLTDLHITVSFVPVTSRGDLPDDWLDPVFRINTLQRLAVVHSGNSWRLAYHINELPSSSSLRLLNLTAVDLRNSTLKLLLKNLPNLEELYLPRDLPLTRQNCYELGKVPNLRILSTVQVDTREAYLFNTFPSLKYLIYDFQTDDEDDDIDNNFDFCGEVRGTMVAANYVLNLGEENSDTNRKLQNLKKVGQLIMPYTNDAKNVLLHLAFNFKSRKPIIEYLVKELHFDSNVAYRSSECFYRPSFTRGYSRQAMRINPPPYEEKYPIEATITHGDLSDVREIVELGAHVECPRPHRSYLGLAHKADIRLFLLERGADPNKSIDKKEFLPVYAYMFMEPKFEDSRDIVMVLKDKCDLKAEIIGRSLLCWTIRNEKWKSFDALLELGLKLDLSEQLMLLQGNANKFIDLITSKSLDIMQINTEIALKMITMNLEQLIAPYINEHINKVDEDGYTLFHYMCTNGREDQYFVLPDLELSQGEKYRWKLLQPENCSWRSSEQKVRDIRQEKEGGEMDQTGDFEQTVRKVSIYESLWHAMFQRSEPKNHQDIQLKVVKPVSFIKPDITILTKDGETGLLLICKANFIPEEAIRRIEEQLSYGVDINQPDKYGWTPLHAVCYCQSWEAATLLLQKGANINAQDTHGITPLMAAVYGNKRLADSNEDPQLFTESFLSLLTTSKVSIATDMTEKYSNRTLLHVAVGIIDSNLTLELLKLGCEINARDADGFTPLHLAVMYGNNDVIKTLIENGADVNAQTNSLKLTSAMVLMQILSVFKTSVCADQVPSNVPYFKYLEAFNTIPRMRQCWRETEVIDRRRRSMTLYDAPWHHKCWYEGYSHEDLILCDEMLKMLTSSADLSLTDVNKNTYLHFLIILYGDNFSGLNEWLNKHEQLNHLWTNKNDHNESNFYLLCSQLQKSKVYGDDSFLFDIVKQQNIDIMECDSAGKFPFYLICSAKWKSFSWEKWTSIPSVDMSAALPAPEVFENCSDIFGTLWTGQRVTPTMLRDMLGRYPAYLNRQNQRGETFLMRLVRQIVSGDTKLDALAIVLEHKSHVNLQDVNGNTALHIACQYFHLGAVDSIRCGLDNTRKTCLFFLTPFMLLDAGADPTIKNNRGETPTSYVPSLMNHYQDLYKWVEDKADTWLQPDDDEMDIDD